MAVCRGTVGALIQLKVVARLVAADALLTPLHIHMCTSAYNRELVNHLDPNCQHVFES